MKKFLILPLLATVITFSAYAQGPRSEINGGIGILNSSSIIDSFSDVLVQAVTSDIIRSEDATYSLTYFLGYKYNVTDRIAIGATYAYAYGKSKAFINNEQVGKLRNNYHTAALEFEYSWLLRSRLALYSKAGAGMTIFHQKYSPTEGQTTKENETRFDFQISPIGIKYGNQFGVFAELGVGYQGIVSAGVFGRF